MNTESRKLISVVVPVYNNEGSLLENFRQIYDQYRQTLSDYDLEVVYVNDGSKDDSWTVLEQLKAEHPEHVTIARLSRNFGQICAILAGYEIARGDAVITMSADLQDPVSLISDMVSNWANGNEIVIAHREKREDGAVASSFSRIAYGIARRANPRIPTGGFDYLLLSRRATEILCTFKGHHRFFQGEVLWLGLPTVFLPYTRQERKQGKSGWTFSKKFKYFIDLVLDSSYLPIRAMSGLGAIVALSGVLYSLVIVVNWLFGNTPYSGWAPIMITILMVGGLLMMMLGIIGEYIWRMYDTIQDRPLYVIERESRSESSRRSGQDGCCGKEQQ